MNIHRAETGLTIGLTTQSFGPQSGQGGADGSADASKRLATFQTHINTWVARSPTAEADGRVLAAHRIRMFLADRHAGQLNLHGLGLSTLPADFRLIGQVCTIRRLPEDQGMIDLRGNTLQLPKGDLDHLQASSRNRLILPQPDPSFTTSLTEVILTARALREHTLPALRQTDLQLHALLNKSRNDLPLLIRQANERIDKLNQSLQKCKVDSSCPHLHWVEDMPIDHLRDRVTVHHAIRLNLETLIKSSSPKGLTAAGRTENRNKAFKRLDDTDQIVQAAGRFLNHLWRIEADIAAGAQHLDALCTLEQSMGDGMNPIDIQHLDAMPNALRQAIKQAQAVVWQIDAAHNNNQLKDWAACREAAASFVHKQSATLSQLNIDLQLLDLLRLLRSQPDTPNQAERREQTLLLLSQALKRLPHNSGWLQVITQHPDTQIKMLAQAHLSSTSHAHGPVNVPINRATTQRQLNAAFEASKDGDLARLHAYLSDGFDPHVRNAQNRTLLHVAAAAGHDDVVRFLAQVQCIPLEACDSNNLTALLLAMDKRSRTTARLLVDIGASLEHPVYESQRTWFLKKAYEGDVSAMVFALGLGANAQAVDSDGNMAIHLAACAENPDALRYCRETLKMSLEKKNSAGRSPVLNAAANGRIQNVKWLIAQGANAETTDYEGIYAYAMTPSGQKAAIAAILAEGIHNAQLVYEIKFPGNRQQTIGPSPLKSYLASSPPGHPANPRQANPHYARRAKELLVTAIGQGGLVQFLSLPAMERLSTQDLALMSFLDPDSTSSIRALNFHLSDNTKIISLEKLSRFEAFGNLSHKNYLLTVQHEKTKQITKAPVTEVCIQFNKKFLDCNDLETIHKLYKAHTHLKYKYQIAPDANRNSHIVSFRGTTRCTALAMIIECENRIGDCVASGIPIPSETHLVSEVIKAFGLAGINGFLQTGSTTNQIDQSTIIEAYVKTLINMAAHSNPVRAG